MNAYGINRPCHPSVGEIVQAEKIFTEYIRQHAHETRYPPESALYSSPELIIKRALGRVWEAGRLYQMDMVQLAVQDIAGCLSSLEKEGPGMNLEELSIQLENAVESLYIMWLTYEEGRVGHVVMSNALKATYDHLNNIAKAITGIVESCPAEIICKCVEVKK